jgi:hypothetical protein
VHEPEPAPRGSVQAPAEREHEQKIQVQYDLLRLRLIRDQQQSIDQAFVSPRSVQRAIKRRTKV